mgnify:FL=1|jgi:hypothetical protein
MEETKELVDIKNIIKSTEYILKPDFKIHNDKECFNVSELRKVILSNIKKIKFIIDPFVKEAALAHKKMVAKKNEYLSDPLILEARTKELIKKYQDEVREKEQEVLKRQNEALEKLKESQQYKKEVVEIEDKLQEKQFNISKGKNLTSINSGIRRIWRAKIVDESLLPRDFLAPDLQKIAQEAKRTNGKANIPGLEFYLD